MDNQLMLGRVKSREDSRTLRAAKYLQAVAPPPPLVDYSAGITSFPMYANDAIRDCTAAGVGHQIQVWTHATKSRTTTIRESTVINLYSAVTGYNPADPSTDQGAQELDVLRYWRKNGVAKHLITAFAAIDHQNLTQVKQAMWVFGGLYIGIDMPLSAEDQIRNKQPWEAAQGPGTAPGSWGGHAVNVVSYDKDGLTCITWGQKQLMTWSFWDMYVSECWGIVSTDWINAGKSPGGLDLATLLKDLGALGKVA